MTTNNSSIRKSAKQAGVLYFFIAILGFWGIMYVPSQIVFKDNLAITIKNIVEKEFLFRSGTVSQLLSSVIFIFLAMKFYQIFKNINKYLAQVMVVLVLVQIPVVFLGEAFNISALMISKGELMKSLSEVDRQEMAYLFLRIYKFGIIILMIFWGLWLIPLGQLIIKSGYLPKIIGILLISGGIAYVIESLDYLLFAEKLSPLTNYTFIIYSLAELTTIAWLLIKGIKIKEQEILNLPIVTS